LFHIVYLEMCEKWGGLVCQVGVGALGPTGGEVGLISTQKIRLTFQGYLSIQQLCDGVPL
jgi:hypothetical protein